ncbi:uncharacterized protein LOC121198862 [Toxotes jaculatrix]|uniref:uncharacterized protein LOC121198862 n=1 Tax=Toxotes jaculatrix TaxID=941984 RepID=UPI001B3AAE74|nr:uncharacterized protein LOC121198862 [Toxotes jaculatrix]
MPANTKKKKKRLRKPTKDKQEKTNKVSIDKTCEAFGSDRPEFEVFTDEMIQWFSDHQPQVDQHFSLRDTDRSGSVNLKDFKLGLMNLGVPCQESQLHMLTELLKTSNNMISYQDLNRQVQSLRLSHSSTDAAVQQPEDVSGLKTCPYDCLLNRDRDRFIRLSVRLIPFDSSSVHPGNFEVVLSSSSRVFGLIRIIQDRVGIQTSRLEVFRSRKTTEEALPPESSLEECGFKGGPEESPPEDTVYYDYRLVFTDCAVLNCDHYFRSKPDSAARRTGLSL